MLLLPLLLLALIGSKQGLGSPVPCSYRAGPAAAAREFVPVQRSGGRAFKSLFILDSLRFFWPVTGQQGLQAWRSVPTGAGLCGRQWRGVRKWGSHRCHSVVRVWAAAVAQHCPGVPRPDGEHLTRRSHSRTVCLLPKPRWPSRCANNRAPAQFCAGRQSLRSRVVSVLRIRRAKRGGGSPKGPRGHTPKQEGSTERQS